MKFLKKFVITCALIFTCTAQASAEEQIITYGAGEWDKIGYTQTIAIKTNTFVSTQTVSSGGGNLQIRIKDSQYGQVYRVWLYEKDDNGYTVIPSSPKYGFGDDILTWDVSSFVNGTNGKAEIFAHI